MLLLETMMRSVPPWRMKKTKNCIAHISGFNTHDVKFNGSRCSRDWHLQSELGDLNSSSFHYSSMLCDFLEGPKSRSVRSLPAFWFCLLNRFVRANRQWWIPSICPFRMTLAFSVMPSALGADLNGLHHWAPWSSTLLIGFGYYEALAVGRGTEGEGS